MHVEMRPIDSMRPYENNIPRLNDAAVDAVAASLRAFGFRQPMVVVEDGGMICWSHALPGGQEARPDRSAGPRCRRPDTGPSQGVPPRRPC
jgi:hypothetical protein